MLPILAAAPVNDEVPVLVTCAPEPVALNLAPEGWMVLVLFWTEAGGVPVWVSVVTR